MVHLAQALTAFLNALWTAEGKKGDPYDRVYFVFDKDSHASYEETVTKISQHKPKDVFHAAVSTPCFEYWLLLHFKFTTRPYTAIEKSSIAEVVINELKEFMPDYEKGSNKIFSSLFSQVEFAKNNAARSLEHAKCSHTDNPTTYIHELVTYLQNLNGGK